ncbi:beta-galactoside alpha--sialyltransferase 1 [Pycnococcus provasolii]
MMRPAPAYASPSLGSLARRLLLLAGVAVQLTVLLRLVYVDYFGSSAVVLTTQEQEVGAAARSRADESVWAAAASAAAEESEEFGEHDDGGGLQSEPDTGYTTSQRTPTATATAAVSQARAVSFETHPLCPRARSLPALPKAEHRRAAAMQGHVRRRLRRRLMQAMGESKDHINKLGKKERLEAKRLIALEDEKSSVSWRTQWCAAEKAASKASPVPPAAAKEIRGCLRAGGDACDAPGARQAISRLASVVGIRQHARGAGGNFPCIFANRALCPVNRTVRAKETGVSYESVAFDLPLPDTDADDLFDTCAVVGNGARTESVADAARLIDAHDAVIRMNDMMRFGCGGAGAASDGVKLCGQGERSWANATASQRRRGGGGDGSVDTLASVWGTKTTFRMLNKKHAEKLVKLGVSARAAGHAAYTPSAGESLVFWNHATVKLLPELGHEFASTRLYLLSADAIDWMVSSYASLRTDAHRLGLGPPSCYVTLSTGMHAVLFAAQMCHRIHLYGFSLTESEVYDRVHLRDVAETPSIAHDWWFDALTLRVLHAAGVVSLCS